MSSISKKDIWENWLGKIYIKHHKLSSDYLLKISITKAHKFPFDCTLLILYNTFLSTSYVGFKTIKRCCERDTNFYSPLFLFSIWISSNKKWWYSVIWKWGFVYSSILQFVPKKNRIWTIWFFVQTFSSFIFFIVCFLGILKSLTSRFFNI